MKKEFQTSNQASRQTNLEKNQQQFYRSSQIVKGWFSQRFQYRFDQIRNSFISQGFCAAICAFIKWRKNYVNRGVPQNMDQLEKLLPINKNPNFKCEYNKIKYTWLGHSTAVIGVGSEFNMIIDPVFSQRSSPIQCIGPKRFRQVPCQIHQLPNIDIVLVSHDHYDHLDENSLTQLQKLFKPQFVAGLNSRDVFPKNCKINQLDWTQSIKIKINDKIFQITFFPVCHWSRRGMFDQGKRLWGGFVIKTPKGKTIFYPGDTGYCQIFKELGQVFGGFDLCILPIGAYQPRELLKSQHFNPEDAVIVHKQLKSKKSVGVHWGTFPLGFEHWCAARQDLKIAAKKHGLKEDEFITVGHGDSFEIDY